jgi:hypothetical protein
MRRSPCHYQRGDLVVYGLLADEWRSGQGLSEDAAAERYGHKQQDDTGQQG